VGEEGKSMRRWLVREGGRRTHRSWEQGAGREQVRRGGSTGREGGESSEGQQRSSRDHTRTGEKEGEARARSGGGAERERERERTRRGGD